MVKIKILILLIFISSCERSKQKSDIDQLYHQSKTAYLKTRTPIYNLADKLSEINPRNTEDNIKFEIIKAQDFMIKSKWDSAIVRFKSAIDLLKNSNTDSLHIAAYFGIANPYLQLGNYEEALTWYLKAEKQAIKMNSKKEVYRSYYAIAQLFQMKGDLKNAKTFLNKAIKNIAYPDTHNYYNAQLTLANIYGMGNQIDSALIIDNKNLKDLSGKNLIVYESFFYNNKGNCYLYRNQFDSSETYFLKCLAIDIQLKDDKQISDSYSCLMNLYATQNDTNKLKNISSKATEYANATNLFGAKQQIYESLVKFYRNKNDYSKAFAYQDSVFSNYKKGLNENSENKISELKIVFDTEKKEFELTQKKDEIIKQRFLIIAISLLLILSIILFYVFYTKNKIKRTLELKMLEQEQSELVNNLIFETEQSERKRIASDLHDSVGQKLAVVKMHLNTPNLNYILLSNLLDESINEVRNISHNLVPYDIDKGLKSAIYQLAEQINYTNSETKISVFAENVITLNKKIELTCFRIIQEIIGNSLKHANANHIEIITETVSELLKIKISDNGIGMDLNTINENGLGLKNIKNRVAQLNGKMELVTSIGNGSVYHFEIPYKI